MVVSVFNTAFSYREKSGRILNGHPRCHAFGKSLAADFLSAQSASDDNQNRMGAIADLPFEKFAPGQQANILATCGVHF